MRYLEQSLQRDIERIRAKLRNMSNQCVQTLRSALNAFLGGNHYLAYVVILRDQNIDMYEKELDLLCLEFLVRQQPVGRPLRFAYGVIKVNSELERIGDYAESIARQVLRLDYNRLPFALDLFEEEADTAIRMLYDAVIAFIDENEELARKTIVIEDHIDELRRRVDEKLMQSIKTGALDVDLLLPLLTVSRRFERVSDLAKEICLEAIYLCSGRYEKHSGGEEFRILFIDENNNSLSQMAEAIGESMGLPRLLFKSAGVNPKPLDSRLISFMTEKGIDLRGKKSVSLEQVPNIEHYQVIIALDEIGKRAVINKRGKSVLLEWLMDDPSKKEGSVEHLRPAYEQAYDFLKEHIKHLSDAILGENTELV